MNADKNKKVGSLSSRIRHGLGRLQRVPERFQVSDVGPRSQIFEDPVEPPVAVQFGYAAPGIFEVAEDDRLRGASLLAGGHDIAVRQFPLTLQRAVLRQLNPLHAQAALLHHAASAHHDVGIQHHPAQRAFHVEVEVRILGVVIKVESPHFVGTVVGAVARPHAAVIHLRVQPLGTGGGGEYGTDRLAGSVATMLAHHGLVDAAGIVLGADVVMVQAYPVHDAGALDLVLSHYGNIVLCLAGDHAGGTSGTRVHVDSHAPQVLSLRTFAP